MSNRNLGGMEIPNKFALEHQNVSNWVHFHRTDFDETAFLYGKLVCQKCFAISASGCSKRNSCQCYLFTSFLPGKEIIVFFLGHVNFTIIIGKIK